MKAFYPISCFLAAASLLLPTAAVAGPDDAPRTRRDTTKTSSRLAPPGVTVRTTTTVDTEEEEERPIQPLRQREESVHYRIAYKLLNNIGFTGTEGDQKPIGYQQIYGPPPMLVYRRPPAPRPRRFPHFAESEIKPETRPTEVKTTPVPPPAPDAVQVPVAPSAGPKPTPEDADQGGVLPDAEQQAAKSRNEEMLSYFRRPGGPVPPQNDNPNPVGSVPNQGMGEPGYLQPPEQLPIPPSRATYRVVPK